LEITAEVPVDADELFDKTMKSIFELGYSSTTVDGSRRRLRVYTGPSSASWGEVVEVFAEPIDEKRSRLRIRARRRVALNIFSNPDAIAQALMRRIVWECGAQGNPSGPLNR
jgi:hypothetical protein